MTKACALLVACLIAAFAAPLRAQHLDLEPRWLGDDRSGCRLLAAVRAGETIAWTGECPNGDAEGVGLIEWRRQGRVVSSFEGALRRGKAEGRGTYTTREGNRYTGEWRESRPHGQGVWLGADGDSYEGAWRGGRYEGRGTFRGSRGGFYDGDWKAGKLHGRGLAILSNGDRYEGQWSAGYPDGQGVATLKGETYAGTWASGCFQQGDRRATFQSSAMRCGFR